MFNNIGAKIKGVLKFFFVLECIGSVVIGIIVGRFFIYLPMGILWAFLVFSLVSAIGILLAWLSCLLVYGYGELIERVAAIDSKLNLGTSVGTAIINCPECGAMESAGHKFCQKCGTKLL
ncbi:MAG: hypothetical protein IKS11_01440 [Lachnospiraceae bacterium]|nr:hypothetical protein [Lachnospiraceae bacterium]